MKRILLIMFAIATLLCTSCNMQEKTPDGEQYTDHYVYTEWRTPDSSVSTLYRINVLTGTGVPVCPDPLCSHATTACPFYGMNTDGFEIIGKNMFYLRQNVALKYHKQVCRFDTESGKLNIIYENDAATIAGLFVFQDYVFFLEFTANSGDGENPVYTFDLLRYSINDKKTVNLGDSRLSQNARIYACIDGRLYWEDPDGFEMTYFSTDTDYKNRIDGDRYKGNTYYGDYSVDAVTGDNMECAVVGIPWAMNVISRKISNGEETVILKNTPAFPMVYGGKVFHFEYQDVPLIVGYYEDENGNKTDNPIYDPRGHKLYVCNFDGTDDRLLCDFGDEYCFFITNEMLGKSGSGDYFVLRMQSCRPSGDGVSLEMTGSVIMVININTGEYKIAEME